MITQAGEILDAADFIEHCLITFAVRVCIFFQIFLRIFSFAFKDHSSGDQIQLGFGAGEVQEFTSVEQRRTCRSDVDFSGTALVQEFGRLTKLDRKSVV